MSDWPPDFDRLAVDLNDRDEQTSSAKTVWVCVDTSNVVGDGGHLKLVASLKFAQAWLADNDPEGVAFEYEVYQMPKSSLGN